MDQVWQRQAPRRRPDDLEYLDLPDMPNGEREDWREVADALAILDGTVRQVNCHGNGPAARLRTRTAGQAVPCRGYAAAAGARLNGGDRGNIQSVRAAAA
jgi:hypothetical protein